MSTTFALRPGFWLGSLVGLIVGLKANRLADLWER